MPSNPRVTVLSAHLDDAVLSCWHIISDVRLDVTVVSVFTGDPPDDRVSEWDLLTGATNSRARMVERRDEDRRALAGHAAHRHLGFPETQYRDGPIDRHAIATAVSRGRSDADALLLGPLGIGDHPDHLLVQAAAALLRRGFGEIRWYVDLPYGSRYGWPQSVTGNPDRLHLRPEVRWRAALARIGATASPRPFRLDDAVWASKRQAMREYATQASALDDGLGRLESRPQLGMEVVYRGG